MAESEKEMEEFNACTTYKRVSERCTISCKLGLWEISGKYGLKLIDEAMHYWKQYKSDGEYSGIIGGKNVADTMIGRLHSDT